MIVFSKILFIDSHRIRNNKQIPVVLENGLKIGSCLMHIKHGLVSGKFQIDEEKLGGLNFYYRFCSSDDDMLHKIQQLVVEQLNDNRNDNRRRAVWN